MILPTVHDPCVVRFRPTFLIRWLVRLWGLAKIRGEVSVSTGEKATLSIVSKPNGQEKKKN